jgi:hypothetical protein
MKPLAPVSKMFMEKLLWVIGVFSMLVEEGTGLPSLIETEWILFRDYESGRDPVGVNNHSPWHVKFPSVRSICSVVGRILFAPTGASELRRRE